MATRIKHGQAGCTRMNTDKAPRIPFHEGCSHGLTTLKDEFWRQAIVLLRDLDGRRRVTSLRRRLDCDNVTSHELQLSHTLRVLPPLADAHHGGLYLLRTRMAET